MRKLLMIISLLLVIVIALVWFLIPPRTSVTENLSIRASQRGIVRALTEKSRWQKWWPADQQIMHYQDINFTLHTQLANKVVVNFTTKAQQLPAYLTVASISSDSSTVIWRCEFPESSDLLQRVRNYYDSRRVKKEMGRVLRKLRSFSENAVNIYGIEIRQAKVKDSTLVAIRDRLDTVPGTPAIYNLVDELRQYIRGAGAKESSHPMLHMQPLGNGAYELMVAIPVNKELTGTKRIVSKRMVLGNILEAEVQGGPTRVDEAMQELHYYVYDHRRVSPAIPFQSLVTDRRKEPDTTRWITRLYYPVL